MRTPAIAAVDKALGPQGTREKLTPAPRGAGARSVSDPRSARNSVGESARVASSEIRRKTAAEPRVWRVGSKKPEQGHLLLVVSLFETYSQPAADSGQERINPLLTASSFEL